MNTKHDDLAAAEYVLGILEPAQKQAFETQMQHDPALKQQVANWQRALGYVDVASREQQPSAQVWERIITRLAKKKQRQPGRWLHLSGWLIAAMLGGVLVFNYLQRPVATGFNQPIAVLNAADGKSQFVVFADRNRQAIAVTALNVSVPDNHSLQLWAIAGANAPVSLGLLPQNREIQLPVPTGVALPGLTLAVSLEPKGGSKLAGPSGPVLYSGVLSRL